MLLACCSTAGVVSCYSSSSIHINSPIIPGYPVGTYDAWHAFAWSCVRIRFDLFLGDQSFERQPLANMHSLRLVFLPQINGGPSRPRLGCLQYHIISYHTCALAAQLLVVVGLCSYYYTQLHMRCYGCSLLHCCQRRYEVPGSCYYCCSCTTAQLVLLSSFFSYIKNQSRPTKNHCCGK